MNPLSPLFKSNLRLIRIIRTYIIHFLHDQCPRCETYYQGESTLRLFNLVQSILSNKEKNWVSETPKNVRQIIVEILLEN